MIQQYTTALRSLFFCLFFSTISFAQQGIVANEDFVSIANGNAQIAIANVMINDSLTYNHVDLSNVSLSQISTTDPLLQLQPDGSVVITANGLANGEYSITYQICDLLSPTDCDSAIATVFVGICGISPPHIGYTDFACFNSSTAYINELPPGNWILRKTRDNVVIADIQGQGTVGQFSMDSPGLYGFKIIDDGNGCISSTSTVLVPICVSNSLNFNYNGVYSDFNSNGVLDPGDIINYSFSLFNSSSTTALNNITVTSSEINISGGTLATLNPSFANSSTFTGIHAITQQDIDAGVVLTSATAQSASPAFQSYYAQTEYLSSLRGIKMIAFLDSNNNGIRDNDEGITPFGHFEYDKNNTGIFSALYGYGETAIYDGNPLNVYSFNFFPGGLYSAYYSVNTPAYQNVNVPVGSGVTNYYFAVTELPFVDTTIAICQTTPPLPGTAYRNIIFYSNQSNQTVPSGTITFVKDNILGITAISQPGTVATANGFTYTFGSLAPHQYESITVDMQIPTLPIVSIGQSFSNSATITVPPGDIFPSNNSSAFSTVIVGSYDPNDKSESHAGKIVQQDFTADDFLTYVVHFENTGNANALNVKIVDVLDNQLDETSVQMVGSSSYARLERVGNTLTWKLDGINLPPSVANSEIGKGYIVFQVKPKTGYAVGDIIPNTADIYFDTNPAIVTNTVQTEFVNTLNVDDFDAANFVGYPNPVHGIFNIQMKNNAIIKSVVVNDVLGKTMLSKTIGDSKAAIDLSPFANGLYFVKINNGNGKAKTIKVLKQ